MRSWISIEFSLPISEELATYTSSLYETGASPRLGRVFEGGEDGLRDAVTDARVETKWEKSLMPCSRRYIRRRFAGFLAAFRSWTISMALYSVHKMCSLAARCIHTEAEPRPPIKHRKPAIQDSSNSNQSETSKTTPTRTISLTSPHRSPIPYHP